MEPLWMGTLWRKVPWRVRVSVTAKKEVFFKGALGQLSNDRSAWSLPLFLLDRIEPNKMCRVSAPTVWSGSDGGTSEVFGFGFSTSSKLKIEISIWDLIFWKNDGLIIGIEVKLNKMLACATWSKSGLPSLCPLDWLIQMAFWLKQSNLLPVTE